jgi:hypothetical protein
MSACLMGGGPPLAYTTTTLDELPCVVAVAPWESLVVSDGPRIANLLH